MIRLKNIQPGIVLIPGPRIRLSPGGVVSVEFVTPEIDRAIAMGLIVRLDSAREPEIGEPPVATENSELRSESLQAPVAAPVAQASQPASVHQPHPEKPSHEPPPPPPDVTIEDLSKLPQTEATHRVSLERDAKKLRALLAIDKRPRVQDAIRRRLSEIESGGSR